MAVKKLEDVEIGQRLRVPITANGVLLLREGTQVSLQLKEVLPRFGVTEIDVNVTPNIEEVDFTNLTKYTYAAMKDFNFAKIVACAKSLVHSALQEENCSLLNVLLDYDDCTYRHSVNVANYAIAVGIKLNFSISELHNLATGALLHDIGKTVVPIEILNKPGRLTDQEFGVVKKHPEDGYRIVSDAGILSSSIKEIIYQHHENYDGSGYPRHLTGKHSYRMARLIHICDVYEALCAKRPYKDPMPRDEVRKILFDGRGSQFDPDLLDAFLRIIPVYLVGETVYCNGRVGIVTEVRDDGLVKVYSDGGLLTLAEFKTEPELCEMIS